MSQKTVRDLLHAAIDKGNRQGQMAGGNHLVVRHNNEVYFETAGVRDIEDDQPFEADTILRIYSRAASSGRTILFPPFLLFKICPCRRMAGQQHGTGSHNV